MTRAAKWKLPVLIGLVVAPFVVTGCTTTGTTGKANSEKTAASHVKSVNGVKTYTYTARDKECLERAMFFESNRSSRDGLVAVGTVVMNRLESGQYPDSICGVVGQKNQFAPGVLSRPMNSKALPDVQAAADSVLKGERHPKVHKNAMFFHQAGLKFPYKNMHYVVVAGGNAFYEKRSRRGSRAQQMVASAEQSRPEPSASGIETAAVEAGAPVLSFDVDPRAADAIGAMLLGARPQGN